MRKKLSIIVLGIAALAALSAGILTVSAGGEPDATMTYRVSITNLTKGQPISPVLVATHSAQLERLFEFGEPASDALAAIAEDADNSLMEAALDPDTNDNVHDLQTILGTGTGGPGPIVPGETASVMIEARAGMRMLSLVGMFVNTNDAFAAVQAIPLPRLGASVHVSAFLDAGSEDNNEDCGFIPGPACGGAGAGVRDPEGAEGFVHVHRGIHGIADLDPAMYDWRNPGAAIVVERVFP